jgi:ribosomal protein S18 acetylase RimI-like enzyme
MSRISAITPNAIRRLLAKEHVIALVAPMDGVVAGGLVAYELGKFEQERREIYIYDLAVADAHRRQGIASALVRRLRDIATQRVAWVMYVQADYGDAPAIALYEKPPYREGAPALVHQMLQHAHREHVGRFSNLIYWFDPYLLGKSQSVPR